jgi:hypothetical protein
MTLPFGVRTQLEVRSGKVSVKILEAAVADE